MASSDIPSDIVFEILSRTSLETLDTCKVVSKTWNDVTYEPSFMQYYCHKTDNILGYFVQFKNRDRKLVSKFVSMDGCSGKNPLLHLPIEALKPEDRFFYHYCDIKIEASSKQGILCCMRRTKNHKHRYYICKPSTKEWKALPNPKMRYCTERVALVVLKSNPLRFKIIRLSHDGLYWDLGPYNYCCEIFDSETVAWKQTNIISLSDDDGYGDFFDTSCPSVNASGLVYFLTKHGQILVLNYNGEEACPRFSLPEPVAQKRGYMHKVLVEYEGKLGFTCLSPKETIELWCIDNTRNHLWKKVKEVVLECLNRSVPRYPSPFDIVFMKTYEKLVFCKQQDASVHAVKLDGIEYGEIFPFRSDLEPMGLKAKEKRVATSSPEEV